MSLPVKQEAKDTTLAHWNSEETKIIKDMICKGASTEEMILFGRVCQNTKLDPFLKQIYGIMRAGKMTIQASIDGLRLVADRTGNYLPGRKTEFTYDKNGRIYSATAFVKKFVRGEWHEISAEAIFLEYAPVPNPKYENAFWRDKPHVMLSKCAEALALRKAFPAEMAGVYTKEEMEQSQDLPIAAPERAPVEVKQAQPVQAQIEIKPALSGPVISQETFTFIDDLIGEHEDIRANAERFLKLLGVDGLRNLPLERLPSFIDWVNAAIKTKTQPAGATNE